MNQRKTDAPESAQDKSHVQSPGGPGPDFRAAESAPVVHAAIPEAAVRRLMQCNRLLLLARLSGPAAHEIINPVAASLNLAVLMQHIIEKGPIPEPRVPEFRVYLSQVVNESKRAGQIASDMLMFARSSDSPPGPTDLNSIVRQALSLAAHVFKMEDVELAAVYAPSLPPVRCDGNAAQQALLNLLLNAIEAVEGLGIRKISIRTIPLENGACVMLTDTGGGMSAETQRKAFDPFFTTKAKPENLGLGLTIARHIIESQQGSIELRSSMGKGTTVKVALFGADERKSA